MKQRKPLPPTIYGRWHPDGFLQTDAAADGLLETKGDSLTVGVYQLVGTTTVRNETIVNAIITPTPKPRRPSISKPLNELRAARANLAKLKNAKRRAR